jgi:predicted metal-dependent HD superfamily phosphohydrolase
MVKQNSEEFFPVSQTLAAELENGLNGLLETFSGNQAKIAELAALMISKYSEKQRFYHNLSHIGALLQKAEDLKDNFADYESVRLAIWFHDAIYEPKSLANEIESAQLAAAKLTELNLPETTIKKVEKMILATQKHDASGMEKDGKLFLDLDLAILGTKPEIYKKYSKAIRQEYSFAPENLYRDKRRMILESFLQREFIYYTGEIRALFEEPARSNIENEIKELS